MKENRNLAEEKYAGKIFISFSIVHAQKTKLKITQLEKVRFIKVNELKLTQVELF